MVTNLLRKSQKVTLGMFIDKHLIKSIQINPVSASAYTKQYCKEINWITYVCTLITFINLLKSNNI